MKAPAESLELDRKWIQLILKSTEPVAREQAYRSLVTKYWGLVATLAAARLGNKQDAEDVAQESFVRAFHALPKLEEPQAFLGWLVRIAQNLTTDRLRGRRPTLSLEALSESAGGIDHLGTGSARDEDFTRALEDREEGDRALSALAELPPAYREVVALKYLQGMDGKTMAEALGEPEGTIRNRLFRALEKLRASLSPTKVQKT